MKKALIVGLSLSVMLPFIGIPLVLRRFSSLGDAISHSSLAGVCVGLIIGFNPVMGAIFAGVISILAIELIRKKIQQYAEVSIVIITSLGVGIAGILSGYIKNANSFNSFLFGSIVAIKNSEVLLVLSISLLIIIISIIYQKELLYIIYDEESAKIAGINVEFINFLFNVMTALAISISARAIGSLIVSSVLVIPVATSMQIAKSYKQTIIYSIIYSIFSVLSGIILSYYLGFKPGASIIIILVLLFFVSLGIKKITKRF